MVGTINMIWLIPFNKDSWFNCKVRLLPSNDSLRYNLRLVENKNTYKVFIAVKNVNWEKSGLVDSWRLVKNVKMEYYDWGDTFDQYSRDWHTEQKKLFNAELIRRVSSSHAAEPIDIFFSYLSGRWIFPETIKAIRKLGIVTINISFDDTRSFWGVKEATGYSGIAEVGPIFDLCITCQNRDDIRKYIAVGARPLFLPPGGNQNVFARSQPNTTRLIPVSFIGQKYGIRKNIVEFVQSHGIQICTRGLGWQGGMVSEQEMLAIYKNSLVTLGFGYVGNGTKVLGLKGRDFEIPLTGTAYLTTYNKNLSEFFEEDKEILFYRNKQDLLEKIQYYISRPDQAIKIGLAGRERALSDHTWDKRWKTIIDLCTYENILR